MINRDFNKLMQSEDYPYISITLTQINLKEDVFEVEALIKIAYQTNL